MIPGKLIQLSISQGVQLACGAVHKLLATRPLDKHGPAASGPPCRHGGHVPAAADPASCHVPAVRREGPLRFVTGSYHLSYATIS